MSRNTMIKDIIKDILDHSDLDIEDQDDLYKLLGKINGILFLEYLKNAQVLGGDFQNQRIYAFSFANSIQRSLLDYIKEQEEKYNE